MGFVGGFASWTDSPGLQACSAETLLSTVMEYTILQGVVFPSIHDSY